jgi:hypothetical protein
MYSSHLCLVLTQHCLLVCFRASVYVCLLCHIKSCQCCAYSVQSWCYWLSPVWWFPLGHCWFLSSLSYWLLFQGWFLCRRPMLLRCCCSVQTFAYDYHFSVVVSASPSSLYVCWSLLFGLAFILADFGGSWSGSLSWSFVSCFVHFIDL